MSDIKVLYVRSNNFLARLPSSLTYSTRSFCFWVWILSRSFFFVNYIISHVWRDLLFVFPVFYAGKFVNFLFLRFSHFSAMYYFSDDCQRLSICVLLFEVENVYLELFVIIIKWRFWTSFVRYWTNTERCS